MSVEELDDLFRELKLQKPTANAVGFTSQHLTYSAWKCPPTQRHLSPDLNQAQLERILAQDLEIGSTASAIAQLKTTVPPSIRLQPFKREVPAEAKPNLLVIVSSIFHHHLQIKSDVTAAQLVASLSQFNVLMPRNPLKKVLAAAQSPGETWEVFAMRPIADGPLLVERTKSYPTNPGAIGMLFEKAMVTEPTATKFHRVYAVRAALYGDLSVALTGEVDCVHPKDSTVVELKTKPEWASRDKTREVETYIQCKLAGVETIVTGKFSSQRDVRNGPVTFHKRNVAFETADVFGAASLRRSVTAFEYGRKTLEELNEACREVGTVYHASGQLGRTARIRAADPSEMTFPISRELIDALASVMATAT